MSMEINSKKYKRFLFFALCFFSSVSLFSFEVVETDFNQYITASQTTLSQTIIKATESTAPEQFDDLVLFMAKPEYSARYMGVAFEHEDFRKIHLFAKQHEGIYYFLYKLNGTETHLDYRLIVDGVWFSDELQPLSYNDSYGHEISRFEISQDKIEQKFGAIELGKREFLFRYKGDEGSRVYFNSDIGSWDPFRYRMKEVDSGIYEVKVRMTPGEHYYYFVENGHKLLGQSARDVRIHQIEGDVNSLIVE